MNKEIIIHPWSINLTEEENEEEEKYNVCACGTYLHGRLEDDNGYDLCGIENFPYEESPLDGFNCVVVMRNGEKRNAKLFVWEVKEWSTSKRKFWKGLIVQEGDEKYMKDAMNKRKRKVKDL